MQELDQLQQAALKAIDGAIDIPALEQYRVDYLGKKGALTERLKMLGQLPVADRPAAGAEINRVKDLLQTAVLTRRERLERAALEQQQKAQAIDVTLGSMLQSSK